MTENPSPVRFDPPKSSWGDGPWLHEPDRVDFQHAGLPCLLLRNHHGVWCGYAAVPPGHPLHGLPYGDVDVDVHGDLTYSDACQGPVCHVPAPGEPADVWWFGFDTAHAFDYVPGMEARMRERNDPTLSALKAQIAALPTYSYMRDVYRDLAYVRAETESLAEQLARQGRWWYPAWRRLRDSRWYAGAWRLNRMLRAARRRTN